MTSSRPMQKTGVYHHVLPVSHSLMSRSSKPNLGTTSMRDATARQRDTESGFNLSESSIPDVTVTRPSIDDVQRPASELPQLDLTKLIPESSQVSTYEKLREQRNPCVSHSYGP